MTKQKLPRGAMSLRAGVRALSWAACPRTDRGGSGQRAETADTGTAFAAGFAAIASVPEAVFVSATQHDDDTITGLLTTVQPQRL